MAKESDSVQSLVSRTVWPWRRPVETSAPPSSCRKRVIVQFFVMIAVAGLLSLKYKHAAVAVAGVALFVIVTGLFVPKLFLAVEHAFNVFGDFGGFHNNITHSLLAALPAGACVYLVLKLSHPSSAVPWASAMAACYGMHVVMDFFTDGRGIMALWPITSERFISPVLVFYGLHWSEGWLSMSHLITVASEGIASAFAIGITHYALRKTEKRSRQHRMPRQ